MKLNLGCGNRKIKGFVNIDKNKKVNPDLEWDISVSIPYDDNQIDYICAFEVLEHIPIGCVIHVINQIWRVLKPKGIFEFSVPSTDGRGAFQDPTHVSFWNINSWAYYIIDDYRNLYDIKAKFAGKLEDIMTDKENRIIHTHGILEAIK